MFEDRPAPEPVLWKTFAAIVIALIVSLLVDSVLAVVLGLIVRIMPPEYLAPFADFSSRVIAGLGGIVCAKAVCDRFFQPYSRHSVFMVIVIISMGSFALLWWRLHWQIFNDAFANGIAATIGAVVGCYVWFWAGEETGFERSK